MFVLDLESMDERPTPSHISTFPTASRVIKSIDLRLEGTMIAHDRPAATNAIHHTRFSALLVALLVLFIMHPVLQSLPLSRIILPAVFSAILLTGLYALSDRTTLFVAGLVLIVPALLASWSHLLFRNPLLLVGGRLLMMLFLCLTGATILVHIFRERRVTTDTLSGAASLYLLIGLVFAFLFWSFQAVEPQSFQLSTAVTDAGDAPADLSVFPQLAYFSLVTLTTLGYGDIAPLTQPARAFAALEAVFGQFFLAILVAKLVGMLIASEMARRG